MPQVQDHHINHDVIMSHYHSFFFSDQKDHEIKIDVKKGVEAKSYDEQVSRYESYYDSCCMTHAY